MKPPSVETLRATSPVRGNISVARDGCARGPNPREGIHGSPRITRIYRCDVVCGGLRGVRAHGAVCVPQTQRCSLEVPLDAARLGMVHRARGKRGKRWAAEMVSLATERLSPPPIFSLPLIRRRTSFRCRRQEVAESPSRQGPSCLKRRTMVARLDREEGSRAGRRSAVLGSDGGARTHAHAGGVRA